MTRLRYRHSFFVSTLLLLFAVGWTLIPMIRAEWTLTSSTTPISLGHGATLVTKQVKNGSNKNCELKLVFFDESQCLLQIASNTSKKEARAVKAIAEGLGAIAACNGGYFDPPKMLPAGLEVATGVRTGTLDLAMPFGGTLLVEAGKVSLIATENFVDGASVEGFIQCCPRLVEKGHAIEGIGGETPAERTFVLTDGKGKWAIGVSKGIGFPKSRGHSQQPQDSL